MRARAGVLALTVVALCPGAAQAAKVHVNVYEPDYWGCKADCPPPTYEVVFAARKGERNDVTVTRDAEKRFVLHDAGPAITTTKDCTAIDPHTVACGPAESELRVVAGDQDDAVTIDGSGPVRVEGGAGNDRLTGGPDRDTLVGGPGNDELHGGAGNDRLLDGVKHGRNSGDDLFDGGDNTHGEEVNGDWVDYAGRLDPISADLGHPDAGAGSPGEHDVFTGIENISGGRAGDRLTGDDARNEIDGGGGPGANTLNGAGGNDIIWSRPGDRTFGGPGADWIRRPQPSYALGTTLERIDCGPEVDVVEAADFYTLVGDTCEVASLVGDPVRLHLPLTSLSDPVLTLDQYTDPSTPSIDSKHIELRASGIAMHRRHPKPGALLAIADTGYTDPFDVRLSERGQELLRRYGRIRVRVLFGKAQYERVGYMIDLRAPAR
jgi:hypothetical protein